MAVGVNLLAQHAATGKTDGKQASKNVGAGKKVILPTVYLGKSDYTGGPIKKETFDELLKQGLTSRDSMGNRYTVTGFQFSYAERNVYEDSLGNLQMLTDLAQEYCPGDTLAGDISEIIYGRVKAGDTLYFEQVNVVIKNAKNSSQPQQPIMARSMKFFIVK